MKNRRKNNEKVEDPAQLKAQCQSKKNPPKIHHPLFRRKKNLKKMFLKNKGV